MGRIGLPVGVGVVLCIVLAAGALELTNAHCLTAESRSFYGASNGFQTEWVVGEWFKLGDPVIAGSGEVRHQETDLLIPSVGFPMRFTRRIGHRSNSL